MQARACFFVFFFLFVFVFVFVFTRSIHNLNAALLLFPSNNASTSSCQEIDSLPPEYSYAPGPVNAWHYPELILLLNFYLQMLCTSVIQSRKAFWKISFLLWIVHSSTSSSAAIGCTAAKMSLKGFIETPSPGPWMITQRVLLWNIWSFGWGTLAGRWFTWCLQARDLHWSQASQIFTTLRDGHVLRIKRR